MLLVFENNVLYLQTKTKLSPTKIQHFANENKNFYRNEQESDKKNDI